MTTPAQADFRLLKSRITLEMIFTHYGGIELRQQGRELRGSCPFCKQEHTEKKGNRNSQRAFAVNPEKQSFYCHACKKGGDIIKFVSEYEGSSLKDAGLKIQEWFSSLFPETDALQETQKQTAPEQPLGTHPPDLPPAASADLPRLLCEILSELRLIRHCLEKQGY